MPSTTKRTTLVAASAATIATSGLLMTPSTVDAAPCEVYGFAGPVTITGTGAVTRLNFSGEGTSVGGPASAMSDKGAAVNGIISGGIVEDGPGVHLTFTPDGGGSHVFAGTIRENDLIATGTEGPGTWKTDGPLACLKEGAPKPGDHMFTLTGDVDMYKRPGGNDDDKLPGFVEGGPGSPQVNLIGCQKDNWCQIVTADKQFVWVWGEFVPPEARF